MFETWEELEESIKGCNKCKLCKTRQNIVCAIGFHSTFLNKATIAIGIYVAIKKGKVKVYIIFSKAVALISFHSVIVVNAPKASKVK